MNEDLQCINRVSGLVQSARLCVIGGKRQQAALDLGLAAVEAEELAAELAKPPDKEDREDASD